VKLLGIDEFGGRLAHAAVALIGLAIYLFVSRTFNYRRAILSWRDAGGQHALRGNGAVLTTDMLLTATMTIALFALFL